MIKIEYSGTSKILKRLCQAVNYLSEHSTGDMTKAVYDTNDDGIVDNAEKVNGHTVECDVPADAQFTDTIYDDAVIWEKLNTLAERVGVDLSELN